MLFLYNVILNHDSDACQIPQVPPAAEIGNLDVDVSPGSPVPSASNIPCDEAAVRADQFAPGLPHCRGGQGQRHQNQVRRPRRGGRSRPQHGRAAPITEQLDKVSLSSDCAERPIKNKTQVNHGQTMQVNTDLGESRTGREVYTEQQEMQVSPDDQPACKSGLETECPKDAADSAGSHGHRGRRRGPPRSAPHSGGPGSARYHWDGRASRHRGGANNLYSRGGGPHRGHGRDVQHKVVEREGGREEVL